MIKKERTVWSRVLPTSPGAFIPLQADLTLAAASSLDADKKRESERMAKDEVMAKVKETEWRDHVSPYSTSEIDAGVLELSKPDSWGTSLQVCSLTWTNMDIRDRDVCWTAGHWSTACWLIFGLWCPLQYNSGRHKHSVPVTSDAALALYVHGSKKATMLMSRGISPPKVRMEKWRMTGETPDMNW